MSYRLVFADQRRHEPNGDKWTTELAFIGAKLLAKCIRERAAYSAEKQDIIDACAGGSGGACTADERGAPV